MDSLIKNDLESLSFTGVSNPEDGRLQAPRDQDDESPWATPDLRHWMTSIRHELTNGCSGDANTMFRDHCCAGARGRVASALPMVARAPRNSSPASDRRGGLTLELPRP